MRFRVALYVILVVSCSVFVVAQETTGEIKGSVRSADGQPLPGVTVVLDDPETGFQRMAVVGSEGTYRMVALKPATYQMTASLDGFQKYRRSVHVDLGSTVSNDIEMAVGAFTDVVEVTGEFPLVDMTSTVTGITLDTDLINARVPVTRDVTRLALLAPGTTPGDQSFNNGSSWSRLNTPGQQLVSFSGASIAENSYVVNGLNVTSLREMMGSTYVPMDFVEEAQVKTGGYEAEFGRATGGVVNLVTKSGTNTLRGGASAYWQPRALHENEPDSLEREYDGTVVVSRHNQDEERNSLEANFSLGGAIVRDKLFFFGFLRYHDGDDLQVWETRAQSNVMSEPYWGAKIDWNPTSAHRLEGTYISDKSNIRMTGYEFDPETRTLGDVFDSGSRFRGGDNYILKYSGVLRQNLLVSAQYGRNEFNRTNLPDGADVCPYAYDRRTGRSVRVGCWLESSVGTDGDARTAARFDVDWFIGRHSLRAGIDAEANYSARARDYSGGIYYRYYLNGDRYPEQPEDTELVRVRTYKESGEYDADSNAAYIQDSWSATPSLTVNIGVRWESYENRNVIGQTLMNVSDQFAPRLGAVWDVGGQGRSKLYGSFGIYHLPMSTEASLHLGDSELREEWWYVLDGGILDDGSPAGTGGELGYRVRDDGTVLDPREAVDSSFDAMSQRELILGYEHMVGRNWSLAVRGTLREFNEVIEDILIDKAMWDVYGLACFDPAVLDTSASCAYDYRLTNPGSDFTGYYDLDGDGELDPILLPAEVIGVPEGERNYYAVELSFKRRFSNNWSLQGSYNWSHNYGNYEGMVNSDFAQVNPYFTKTFDVASLMEGARGDLPNDRRHTVKLFGVYAWNSGVQIGSNFWWRTGRPVNGLGMHPTDPWGQWYGNRAFYNFGQPCPRGCGGRSADTWSLDLMVRYDFPLGNTDWYVRVDAFNVFNQSPITEVDEDAQDESYLANPSYLMPRYYQPPRSVRLGFGLSF